jgi:hypothetical protein
VSGHRVLCETYVGNAEALKAYSYDASQSGQR